MKIKIEVPETLSDITLDQYQRYLKAIDGEHTEDFIKQKTIEVFCNIDFKNLATIEVSSLNRIYNKINNLFNDNYGLITTFKIEGKEYGFIPDLSAMTLGEFIDLDTTISDWESIHKSMAVLFRPIKQKIGKKYLIEDYEGYSKNLLKEIPLDVALGAFGFFWTLSNELMINTQNYLAKQMDNPTSQQVQDLQSAGVGSHQFTQWQKEMSSNLITLQS
tara:strand:+ start:1862 stop:2515 length:654 start_codon:yes stop_codon:yes gene_type:complete